MGMESCECQKDLSKEMFALRSGIQTHGLLDAIRQTAQVSCFSERCENTVFIEK